MNRAHRGHPANADPREAAAYPLAEAARYLRLPPGTLRAWTMGREYPNRPGTRYFAPLIQLPDRSESTLSFSNLVEAHVLRSFRTVHAVSIQAVRDALGYAQQEFEIQRLLLSPELRTNAGDLFLDRYGDLVNLSKSGQLAMRKVLEAYLARIERDIRDVPIRLHPFVRTEAPDERRVVIDPFIAFGRPVVSSRSISTAAIADRIDAGETVEDVAMDYGLEVADVEEAVLYERAA